MLNGVLARRLRRQNLLRAACVLKPLKTVIGAWSGLIAGIRLTFDACFITCVLRDHLLKAKYGQACLDFEGSLAQHVVKCERSWELMRPALRGGGQMRQQLVHTTIW